MGLSGERVTAAAPTHLSVKGSQILAPDGKPIVLRGFNILWWTKPSAQDAVEIKKLGGNCVRYMFGYHPKGKYDSSQLKELETHVRYFTGKGIWVIPTVHQVVQKEGEAQLAPWDSPGIQREFLDLWTDVVKRLKDDPFIAAWEPMNEPHSYTRELTTTTLRAWYGEVIAHLRRLDPERPLVLEGDHYSYARNLGAYLKVDDPGVIYSFHVYNPFNYTHQKSEKGGKGGKDGTPPAYPSPGKWDKAFLEQELAQARLFREEYHVPVYCGEWGVMTKAPGYKEWVRDVAAILEENGYPWSLWAWVGRAKEDNTTFDVSPRKPDFYQLMSDILSRANHSSGTRMAAAKDEE